MEEDAFHTCVRAARWLFEQRGRRLGLRMSSYARSRQGHGPARAPQDCILLLARVPPDVGLIICARPHACGPLSRAAPALPCGCGSCCCCNAAWLLVAGVCFGVGAALRPHAGPSVCAGDSRVAACRVATPLAALGLSVSGQATAVAPCRQLARAHDSTHTVVPRDPRMGGRQLPAPLSNARGEACACALARTPH
jgi:hypothetical protein